jgi:hypothetical protein
VPIRYTISGKVYLAGAGPGSAKLLTLGVAELLKEADVVLHDDLVLSEVLALIPAHTAVHNVGKRCGEKSGGAGYERFRGAALHSPERTCIGLSFLLRAASTEESRIRL